MDDGEPQPGQPEAQPIVSERGPQRLDMVDKVIPERDDWDAKTNLEKEDAWRVAALRNIGDLIPSVEHQQDTIDEWLDDYMKNKTSEEGKSRKDIFSTVRSLFGGNREGEGSGAGLVVKGLGGDVDDE